MKQQRWHRENPLNCPVVRTLNFITGKWKPMILHLLISNESLRHSEIKKSIQAITQKVLTAQLRELEKDGLITRTTHEGKILHVEYALSDLGKTLIPVLDQMHRWGQKI